MPKVKNGKLCAEEMETEEMCEEQVDGDGTKSIPKHCKGAERPRVCLEVPQEVRESESEAFPEQLSSTQNGEDLTGPREWPVSESVQQGERRPKPPDCVGSARSDKLKMVKLEEEGAPDLQDWTHLHIPHSDPLQAQGKRPFQVLLTPSLNSQLLAKDWDSLLQS